MSTPAEQVTTALAYAAIAKAQASSSPLNLDAPADLWQHPSK